MGTRAALLLAQAERQANPMPMIAVAAQADDQRLPAASFLSQAFNGEMEPCAGATGR